ncbi:STAS/SEC14 domain-containing protein, partial [Fibrobacterota bacterium]
GEIDGHIARKSCEAMFTLRNMAEEKAHFLIDLNEGGKTTSEARTVFKEFTEQHVDGKLAFFGMHPVAKILASFFMGLIRKKNMKFFKTEEDALAWINGKK